MSINEQRPDLCKCHLLFTQLQHQSHYFQQKKKSKRLNKQELWNGLDGGVLLHILYVAQTFAVTRELCLSLL